MLEGINSKAETFQVCKLQKYFDLDVVTPLLDALLSAVTTAVTNDSNVGENEMTFPEERWIRSQASKSSWLENFTQFQWPP